MYKNKDKFEKVSRQKYVFWFFFPFLEPFLCLLLRDKDAKSPPRAIVKTAQK